MSRVRIHNLGPTNITIVTATDTHLLVAGSDGEYESDDTIFTVEPEKDGDADEKTRPESFGGTEDE